MELEKESIFTLQSHEENVAGEFLSSGLLKDLEEYDHLLTDVSQKEKGLNNTVYYLNVAVIIIGLGNLISSFSTGGVKYFAMGGLVAWIFYLLEKENLLMKWSATKTMQGMWGFVVKKKVFNKDVAFSRLQEKTDLIVNDLNEKKNKVMIAKLYHEFNKKDHHKILRNRFAKMMICYKQENNQEILKELLEVFKNVKSIMSVQNDDFMADDIARELIENDRINVLKEKNIFKKRESYMV